MKISRLMEKLQENLELSRRSPCNLRDPEVLCYDKNGMSTNNIELDLDDGGKDGY